MPLDHQGDREYQQAVAELESAEVPLDLIAEVIPVGIPVPPKRYTGQESVPDPDPPVRSPLEARGPFGTPLRLLMGIAVLFLIGLALGGLLLFVLTQ